MRQDIISLSETSDSLVYLPLGLDNLYNSSIILTLFPEEQQTHANQLACTEHVVIQDRQHPSILENCKS